MHSTNPLTGGQFRQGMRQDCKILSIARKTFSILIVLQTPLEVTMSYFQALWFYNLILAGFQLKCPVLLTEIS